jgi:ATP-dependent Clp protease ATP-binding subunit ClpC
MENNLNFVFNDPRLNFTQGGKMIVRIVTTSGILILLVLTVVLLLSDVSGLRYFGAFLVLFWIDFLVHINQGRRTLEEMPTAGTVNAALFFKPFLLDAIGTAVSKQKISGEHFGLALTEEALRKPSMQKLLLRLDIDPREFGGKIQSLMTEFRESGQADESLDEFYSPEFLEKLIGFAKSRETKYVERGDVLAALFMSNDHRLERLRKSFSLNEANVGSALMLESAHLKAPSISKRSAGSSEVNPINKAWTSRPTPELDALGEDITVKAALGIGRVLVGHDKEFLLLSEGLSKTVGPNVLLVGAAGSGKGSMVEHLANTMALGTAPPPLNDMRLVTLDISRLAAGADQGGLQARLEKIVQEILTAGNIALYIPDTHILFKTSGKDEISAADTLLPILTNDNFPVVGTTTPEDFARTIEVNGAFAKVFEKIAVEEVDEASALRLLTTEGLELEARTGVMITVPALRSAVSMAKAHLRPKILPGSARELLSHALDLAKRKEDKTVTSEHVYAATEEITKVPVRAPGKEEETELLNLEKIIHKKFINQEEAVKAVADALREYRSGLTKEGGPIASFLFVGPTGVGKTALAKLLAELQFGNKEALIRFDMSEYQDKQSVFQFIGSPDGSMPGALTEAVRSKPHALLLFDEFEKAYPDIQNLFLQVLDDARLTDTLGRTVDFKETVIIATSNAHSEEIQTALKAGKSITDIAADFKNSLTDVFKPELINRFSKIIVFKNLGPEDLKKIATIHLQDFIKSLESKSLKLEIKPEVVEAVSRWGYDASFGARPLDRVIEEKLRAPLAQFLLANHPQPGSTIEATLEGESVSFSL